ncbi:MAG: hypothetical protein ACREDQ_07765 [Limisphaerales bacterium]
MKKKPPTLRELKKSWWWRRRKIRRRLACDVDWPVVEEAARNYELMRRSPMGKQFAKAYWELGQGEKPVVHGLWAKRFKTAYRCATRREQYNERGWTAVDETEHRQWNLRLADKDLIDEFIQQIRILRIVQKIRPQHTQKGEKHRGVSWRYIEILDRMKCPHRKLFSAGERHMASIGRRRAARYFSQYSRALVEHAEKLKLTAAFFESLDENRQDFDLSI